MHTSKFGVYALILGFSASHQRQKEQKGNYEIVCLGMGLHSGIKSMRFVYHLMCLHSQVFFYMDSFKGRSQPRWFCSSSM